MENIKNRKRLVSMGVIMLLLFLAVFSYNNLTVDAAGTIIIVNPGHLDGVDSGAVNSSNGIREVDLNNALAIKIVSTLRASGYNAMLSHPIPGNPGLPTMLSSVPNYDLFSTTICNNANAIGADLLLSIHHNSGGNASGYELYWSSYHPSVDVNGIYQVGGLWSDGSSADLDSTPPEIALRSRNLANSLNENFKSLGYVPTRNKIVERDDAITRKTSMPSVLIEAGYVSNAAESVAMANGSNQQKMANQILASVKEYFGVNNEPMTASGVTASTEGTMITTTVKGITAPNGIRSISVPIWSDIGGQDDLKWYTATIQSDGSYSVIIDIKDHNYDSGMYNIHGYGTDNSGKMTWLGSTSVNFNVSSAPMTATSVTGSFSASKITAIIKGITAPNGIKSIVFPVWSDVGGQDDLRWYTATKQSDGSYSITIDIKDHNYDVGSYIIHGYGIDNYNRMTFVGNTIVEVKAESMTASSLTANVIGDKIAVTINGITAPNGIKSVSFPVWSEINGQDDLKWYTATKQSDGSYSSTIDIKDHNYNEGTFIVHGYGIDNNDKMTFLGVTNAMVKIESMTATSVTSSVVGSKFTATVKGITAPYGITGMLLPIWSDNGGQDDLKWYAATKQSDGSYSVTIDIKDHNYDGGIYNIHSYGKDNNNKMTFVGATTANVIVEPMTATSVTGTLAENKITVIINGINAPNGVRSISVPVWSDVGGQDDLIWYSALKQSDGSYSAVAEIKDHNYAGGSYNMHVYGTDNNGKVTFLGKATVSAETTVMSASAVVASVTENIITVTVSGINAPNGIKSILIPVWSDVGGQDDIKWYTAIPKGDGSYQITIDAKNHNGDSGTYSIHVYGADTAGKLFFLGNTATVVSYIETPIMGETTVTAAELVAYYKATGSVYPQSYIDLGVNLEKFVEIYIQECKAEGVRTEVAFAQAMLETGNLQFSGDVKVGQFNFAGLGATGGVPGYDFATVYGYNSTGLQTGIRGHVQHLKCYASSAALNQTKVDPRWSEALRLRAVSVEELAGTWAGDTTYATKVKTIINRF